MMKLKIVVLAALLSVASSVAMAAPSVTSTSFDLIDNKSQFFNAKEKRFDFSAIGNAFQQNPVLIMDGRIFVAYYNSSDKLVVARRSISGGDWARIVFPYTQTDPNAHRTAEIGYSPVDNRLHVAWGHHGSTLKYIISDKNINKNAFKESRFSSRRNYLKSGITISKLTYPRFVIGKNGTLIMTWRQGGSGKADSKMIRYNNNGTWGAINTIVRGLNAGNYKDPIDSTIYDSRNAYFNDFVTHNNRLHASWTYRESAKKRPGGFITNHDLMYAYSDNNGLTWKNRKNKVIGQSGRNSGNKKITINSDAKIKTLSFSKALTNQNGMAIDGDGNVHIVVRHRDSNDKNRYVHYYKKAGSTTFSSRVIPFSADKRPSLEVDKSTNTLYVVGIANVGRDRHRLVVYAANEGSKNWASWKHIYTSSFSVASVKGTITRDYSKLMLLTQRRPSDVQKATSARLDLAELKIKP